MRTWIKLLLTAIFTLSLTACDDDEFEHNPPEGQSGLIIVNNSATDLNVFIDGERAARVDSFDDRTYNYAPGLHRIILDPRNSSSTYQDEIELLVNRTLVLLVSGGAFEQELFVEMRLD
jgi:hypothetical protein